MTRPNDLPSKHVSTFELDLLEAGALDGERAQRASEHLKACAECREEQAALRVTRDEFANEVFARTSAPLFRKRRRATVPLYRRTAVWVPVLASAAAIVLAIGLDVSKPSAIGKSADLQVKGGTDLSLIVRRKGAQFPVTGAAAELRAGDELRFVVISTTARASHLLIVSVDGAGKASVYFPFQGNASRSIEPGGRLEVPGSVVLDASPGPERIFALFSPEPLDARPVLEQLSRLGTKGWMTIRKSVRLEVPGVDQHSLLIEKAPADDR